MGQRNEPLDASARSDASSFDAPQWRPASQSGELQRGHDNQLALRLGLGKLLQSVPSYSERFHGMDAGDCLAGKRKPMGGARGNSPVVTSKIVYGAAFVGLAVVIGIGHYAA
jgi:hypothetical protein